MENLLALLPYLACPIVMGGAVWLMGRGRPAQGTDPAATAAQSRRVSRATPEGSSSAPAPQPVPVARATSISLPRLMWLVWLMMRGNPTRQSKGSAHAQATGMLP